MARGAGSRVPEVMPAAEVTLAVGEASSGAEATVEAADAVMADTGTKRRRPPKPTSKSSPRTTEGACCALEEEMFDFCTSFGEARSVPQRRNKMEDFNVSGIARSLLGPFRERCRRASYNISIIACLSDGGGGGNAVKFD